MLWKIIFKFNLVANKSRSRDVNMFPQVFGHIGWF